MKIGIDGNEANIGYKVGVHQYAFEILWSFYRLNQQQKERHDFIIYLKNPPSKQLPSEKEWWKYKILQGKRMWLLTRLTPHLMLNHNDVFFSPNHYLPLFSKTPKVLTVHDLGYLEFSEQFNKKDYYQMKYWTANSISAAKKIIAVSKSTKKDILKHYNIDNAKVEVVHHGYDSDRFNIKRKFSDSQSILKKYNLPKKYLLYMGTLKPSKNVTGLIEAYYRLSDKYKKEYKLVIAGKKGWLYEEIFSKVRLLKLQDYVVFTGYIEEQDKEVLYSQAKVLVQPSFWEGFGMQVLDSMAMGTPVVISEIASLPEVGGEAAVYVNAEDVLSIRDGIEKVLGMNEVQYNKLVQKGLIQIQKFSWEKSAKKTLKVLKEATNENW